MRIERISSENRREVNCFLEEHWFTTTMALRGELIDMTVVPGFVIYEDGDMCGLVTYRECGKNAIEILSLDSSIESKGYGTILLDTMVGYADAHGLKKITVCTTNDNIHALRFYQKRGFDIVAVHRDTIAKGRALKPEIPLIGYNGIPIHTELELERTL